MCFIYSSNLRLTLLPAPVKGFEIFEVDAKVGLYCGDLSIVFIGVWGLFGFMDRATRYAVRETRLPCST